MKFYRKYKWWIVSAFIVFMVILVMFFGVYLFYSIEVHIKNDSQIKIDSLKISSLYISERTYGAINSGKCKRYWYIPEETDDIVVKVYSDKCMATLTVDIFDTVVFTDDFNLIVRKYKLMED